MNVLKTPAGKAMLAFVVVMAALIFALWPRSTETPTRPSGTPGAPSQGVTDQDVPEAMLAQARTDAGLAPCPQSTAPVPDGAALKNVTAVCLADGRPVNLGQATAGRPTVINMWAVWCLPCRKELPYFDELSQRAGDRLDVLAVHAIDGATKPYAILQFMKEVGLTLPAVADTDGSVAKALKAPRVYPSTILVRADGTVAVTLPKVFTSYDELATLVRDELGVDATGGQS